MDNLSQFIRDIPDYPKPGILFRDITPLLSDPGAFKSAIEVMAELGVDLSDGKSEHVDQYSDQAFDLVVTVCDNAAESCPVFPGDTPVAHWPFEDPADATGSEDEILHCFRDIRDQIANRIKAFLSSGE